MAKRSSLAYPSENLTSQKVWDATRAQELYGESPAPEARKTLLRNARSILQKIQESIETNASLPGLLVYISQKSDLLSDKEVYHLKRKDFSTKQKSLLLVNYIADRKKTPVERLYLCLLDSYNQPGMEGHYIVARRLRDCALREIKQKTVVKDVEEIVLEVENVPLRSDIARILLSLLQVPAAQGANLPADFHSLCQMWFSSGCDCSLEVLVRALLCTPTLGYLVTGLTSICESSPPEVWRFVESIGEKWSALALFMGYQSARISSLTSQFPGLIDQMQQFLRIWRVPDCKTQTDQILGRLLEAFEAHQLHVHSPVSSDSGYVEHPMLHDSSVLSEEPTDGSQSSVVHEEVPWPLHRPNPSATAAPNSFKTDLHRQAPDADTGLLDACKNKDWELANLLVHAGALECKDEKGRTPLHICCKERQTELVVKLIEFGACLTASNERGDTCLHLSEVLMNSSMLAILLDAFACRAINVDQRNWEGMSPLLIACLIGDSCADGVKALLDAGADSNGNEQAFFRPLTAACAGGHERVVILLLNHGASVNILDREGRTPLTCACLGYAFDIAKLLTTKGADARIAGKRATTALHVCADRNAIDLAETLLEHGADPNRIVTVSDMRNITGTGEVEETPLTCACSRGHLKMVQLLCKHDANVNELCSGIAPPVGFAIIFRQHHIVDYLVDLPQFDRSYGGLTAPIHIAIRCKNYACIPFLLQRCKNCTVAEAFLYASENSHRELQESLQRYLDSDHGQTDEETCVLTVMTDIEEKKNECNRWSSSVHSGELYLSRLCQIVVNILRYKPNIEFKALAEAARAGGLLSVSSLLLQCLNFSLDPIALKTEFLIGEISALRFVLQHHVITLDDFYDAVYRYYPDGAEEFCTKLVMTFHEVNGGHELPFDNRACLKKLISGGFVPAVSRTQVSGGGGECVEQAGIVTDTAAERNVECDGFPGVGRTLSENNSGTSEQTSAPSDNRPTVTSMMEELSPLSEWYEFGTALNVKWEKLQEIERVYHLLGLHRYNIELFHHWLQWCVDPTWEKVAHALEVAGVVGKARAVREKYCEKSAGKDGGERTVQEGQSARVANAAQHRPASTTTSTTNDPPDNSQATPVDAIDNRFAQSTTNKTSPTKEVNNLSQSSPNHSATKTNQQRSIEVDGAQHMQQPVTGNHEMQATPKSAFMENKGNLRDPGKLKTSRAENFGDMGREKSHNEEVGSRPFTETVVMERAEDIPAQAQVRKACPEASPLLHAPSTPPHQEDADVHPISSKSQSVVVGGLESMVEDQDDINFVLSDLRRLLEYRMRKDKYTVKIALYRNSRLPHALSTPPHQEDADVHPISSRHQAVVLGALESVVEDQDDINFVLSDLSGQLEYRLRKNKYTVKAALYRNSS